MTGLDRLITNYHRLALLLGGVLLSLSWSRIISVGSRTNFIRSTLLLAALSTLLLCYQRQARKAGECWPWAWVMLCLYFAALALWNQVYFAHIATSGYAADVFRNALRTFQAPVYGVAQALGWAGLAWMLVFAIAFYLVLRHAFAHAGRGRVVLASFMVLELASMASFAAIEAGGSWPDPRLIHGGFEGALSDFATPGAVWSQWNEHLAQIKGRASHYPPGPLFIAFIEYRHGLAGLWMVSSMLSVVLCLPLLRVLCADLGLAPVVGVCALAWQLASAAFVSFTPIANAAPTALLTLTMLAALGRALRGHGGQALVAGVALGVHGLYSFTAVFGALLAGAWLCCAVLTGAVRIGPALRCGALLLAGSLGLWLLVYGLTDFNIATCLLRAIANNRDAMSHELLESPLRYGLRSSGNLLAYGAYLGPLAALYGLRGAWRARRGAPAIGAFALATVTSVLLAAGCGNFFLETERVWMFFTPAVVILAGLGLAPSSGASARFDSLHLPLLAGLLAGAALAIAMSRHMPGDEHINAADWQRARALLGAPTDAPRPR